MRSISLMLILVTFSAAEDFFVDPMPVICSKKHCTGIALIPSQAKPDKHVALREGEHIAITYKVRREGEEKDTLVKILYVPKAKRTAAVIPPQQVSRVCFSRAGSGKKPSNCIEVK